MAKSNELTRVRNYEDLKEGPCLIMPEAAEQFLKKTIHIENQVRTQSKVKFYAQAMKEGKWQLGVDGIGFTKDFKLINGVHRCSASVISKTPFPVRVALNVEEEAFLVTDIGGKRTMGQIARIAYGIKNSNAVAATVRVMIQYRKRKMGNFNAVSKSSPDEYIELMKAIESPVSTFHKEFKTGFMKNAMTPSFASAVFSIGWLIDEDLTMRLFDGIRKNSFETGEPLHSIRLMFERMRPNTREFELVKRASVLVRALNDQRDEKVVLRYNQPREETACTSSSFPILWGVQPEDLPF